MPRIKRQLCLAPDIGVGSFRVRRSRTDLLRRTRLLGLPRARPGLPGHVPPVVQKIGLRGWNWPSEANMARLIFRAGDLGLAQVEGPETRPTPGAPCSLKVHQLELGSG